MFTFMNSIILILNNWVNQAYNREKWKPHHKEIRRLLRSSQQQSSSKRSHLLCTTSWTKSSWTLRHRPRMLVVLIHFNQLAQEAKMKRQRVVKLELMDCSYHSRRSSRRKIASRNSLRSWTVRWLCGRRTMCE